MCDERGDKLTADEKRVGYSRLDSASVRRLVEGFLPGQPSTSYRSQDTHKDGVEDGSKVVLVSIRNERKPRSEQRKVVGSRDWFL